jgi:hypothetical protein
MTLKEIRAQFNEGDKWHCVRTDKAPLIVNGNTGQTVLGTKHRDEIRTVGKLKSKEIMWHLEDGSKYYTPLPAASEIVEAKPGFLHFTLLNGVVSVTLTKLACFLPWFLIAALFTPSFDDFTDSGVGCTDDCLEPAIEEEI